jgi:hypothetical protein
MADYNSLEELDQWLARQKEMYEAGYLSAKELAAAEKDHAAGIKGYTANLKQSMAQLGTSFKALGKDIYAGKQGAAVLNDSMESGANAVAAYAAKFGPAGQALGLFTKAVAGFVAASLKQSDALYDAYTKISKSGTVGAEAMDEVRDQMSRFGYTIDQLDNLNAVLSKNSKNLGTFYHSALEGARVFGDAANQLQNSKELRTQLFNLGLTVDDINDGIGGYIAQQGKLGRLQGQTGDQLAAGTFEYLKQLDALTKLTGMSRQEQEEAREQALQVEAFYAGLADLDPDAAEQAMEAYTQTLAKGGPKAAAEMAANFNGAVTGSTDLMISTGGASMKYFSKEFFARGGTADQALAGVVGSITPAMMEATKYTNQFGGSVGLNLRTLTQLKGGTDLSAKVTARLTEEQKKQLAGQNAATKSQAGLRDNQIRTSQKLQDFVAFGIDPATKALEYFTDAVDYVTDLIPGASSKKKAAEEAKKYAVPKEQKGTLQEKIIQVESGGVNKPNESGKGGKPTSSAYGLAQMTSGTFEGLAKSASPSNPLYGKTFDDMKQDEGLQREALSQLLDQNRMVLSKAKVSTTDAALYLAHFLGPYGAVKALQADDSTQISAVVSPDQFQANQKMFSTMKDVGDLKKWADNKMGGGGYRYGGVASGPTSGYETTLHGTEAVVPLPDGRSIPVQQQGESSSNNEFQMSQLDKLDEMISLLKSQVNVSTRIMQSSV